jgi:hypothetical protein
MYNDDPQTLSFTHKEGNGWVSDFINVRDVNRISAILIDAFPTGKLENLGIYTMKDGPYTGLYRLKMTFENDADEAFFLLKSQSLKVY